MNSILARQRIVVPPRFNRFYRELKNLEFTMLDVGCGNHSPAIAKKWFPLCRYYGLDRVNYNNDEADFKMMDGFHQADLSNGLPAEIRDGSFDVIIMNHVIEHLPNGLEIVARLIKKLKNGGRIYIEFPSVRSLRFPSMKGGLNFHDDSSHVRAYEIKEVADVLMNGGLSISAAGTRRSPWKMLVYPLLYPLWAWQGRPALAFWDLLGFAEFVYAVKEAQTH